MGRVYEIIVHFTAGVRPRKPEYAATTKTLALTMINTPFALSSCSSALVTLSRFDSRA